MAYIPQHNCGVATLDSDESLWQLNWVHANEPPINATIRTKDGQRLWLQVTLRDITGPVTMYMTEAAALSLAGFATADEFEIAHAEGKLWFPQVENLAQAA